MFNKHGIRIKEASKFSTTILVSNVNASYGDVPTPEWFTVGGYSVNAASNFASFAKEFGERFTDSYISVLEELYSTRK